MSGGPNIARIGALLGDTARARMLTALMSGRALTASELATEAGITPQTASGHLAQLEAGGLLRRRRQGRHRYFCLANDEVAALIETLMGLSAEPSDAHAIVTGPRSAALREARVCYRHLAGSRAVALYDSLIARGLLRPDDGVPQLTESGATFMTGFGIDVHALKRGRAPLCRACLDWSERRSHLAGSLGRALFTRFEALGWMQSLEGSRAVRITRSGERAFAAFCTR